MSISDAGKLKALEAENTKLKRWIADTMLDNSVIKDLLGKISDTEGKAGSWLAR